MDSSDHKLGKISAEPASTKPYPEIPAEAEPLFAALGTFLGQAADRGHSPGISIPERPRELTEEILTIEDRYKVLVEQIPAVVFMAFLDGGISEAYVSPQVEQVLGFSREEWLDDPIRWYHQIHPDDRHRWSVEAAEILLKGNPLKSVYRVMARDGHVVWFHCEARLVRRKDGQPWFVHGVGFDITDLKRTEQALHEETAERERLQRLELERQVARNQQTESRLASIVDSCEDAIVSKDLYGIITSWNKSAERMFGYMAEEAIGRHITLIAPDDRLGEESTIIERLKRGERIEHFETVRRRKGGTLLDVSISISPVKDAAGIVVGAWNVARDITERRLAERALHESQERFRSIVETTPECVKLVAPDGTLLHMNSPGLKMIGADCADAVVGKSAYDLIAPKDRDRFREFNERICRGDKGSLEFDIVGLRGECRHMESHSAPLRNPDGTIVQLAVTRDITERKKGEEAIKEKELSARLLKLQDEERRRIARELHDGAGQLLAAMGMNAARLDQEKSKLSPDAARCAEDNVKLIEQVSSDIRTMSYLFHPPLLDEMGLDSALKWYLDGFSERSKIVTKLEVSTNRERLPQDYELCLFRIAQECLTNIHRHSGSSTALVRLFRSPGEIKLEVSDEGRGVDRETQSKIAAGDTAGVGLRGMRERVRQLGGRIEIRSNGKGTTVTAIVPFEESGDPLRESFSGSPKQRANSQTG